MPGSCPAHSLTHRRQCRLPQAMLAGDNNTTLRGDMLLMLRLDPCDGRREAVGEPGVSAQSTAAAMNTFQPHIRGGEQGGGGGSVGKGPVGRGGGTRAPAAVTATAALSFASFPQRPLRSKHGVTQARASRAPEAPTCQRDAPAAPPAIPGQGVPLQEEPSSSPRQGGRPTAAPSPAQGRRGEEAVKGGGEGGGVSQPPPRSLSSRMLANPTGPPAFRRESGIRTLGAREAPGREPHAAVRRRGWETVSFASPASLLLLLPGPLENKQGRRIKSLFGPYRGRAAAAVGARGLIRHERWQPGKAREPAATHKRKVVGLLFSRAGRRRFPFLALGHPTSPREAALVKGARHRKLLPLLLVRPWGSDDV